MGEELQSGFEALNEAIKKLVRGGEGQAVGGAAEVAAGSEKERRRMSSARRRGER